MPCWSRFVKWSSRNSQLFRGFASRPTFFNRRTHGPSKDRTTNAFARMPRGLRIRKISQAQIVLVLMDNEGASEQILNSELGDQIGIMSILFVLLLNIPQITRMTGHRGSWPASVWHGRSYVEMLAGPEASWTSQIAGLVNVKSVLTRGELRKRDGKSCFGADLFGDGFALNIRTVKDCYNYHCRCHVVLLTNTA